MQDKKVTFLIGGILFLTSFIFLAKGVYQNVKSKDSVDNLESQSQISTKKDQPSTDLDEYFDVETSQLPDGAYYDKNDPFYDVCKNVTQEDKPVVYSNVVCF